MWLYCYFNFERNFDVLKSKSPCFLFLLKKNIIFNENKKELKMENLTHASRETRFVLQLKYELGIKSKTVMSWN